MKLYARESIQDDLRRLDDIYDMVNTAFQTLSVGGIALKERITRAQLARFIEADDQLLILAFDRSCQPEKVVGVGSIEPKTKQAKTAFCNILSVHTDYRKHGVAELVIRQGIIALRERCYTKGSINAHESTKRLIAFYKRLGFKDTGERIPFSNEYLPYVEHRMATSNLIVLERDVVMDEDPAFSNTLASSARSEMAHRDLARPARASKI
ncbi:hypothetical protein BCR43DRAFT_464812 [Syncephalastrum racemosum]|uniref:N-acetyltransferase domain-containing protein n=1 Tax=Syncephalastrum racemosum TaxID=13706 RepID=A0A1X2GZR6_SYNRA|nr:hypothetical protein BCR43DRAFT_464812 [Syncephalastrum racemosum]